jgi:Protoglobin
MNDAVDTSRSPAATEISGYDFGASGNAPSPVSLDEIRRLEACAGWTEEDARVLERHHAIFLDQAERMVDAWRSVIGSQPHLAKWFFGPDGKPDEEYKAKVKARFVQWVRDVCLRPHDQHWLNYQEEIGRRHTPAKKNLTDGAHTPDRVPLRYLIAFTSIVAITARQFFVEYDVTGGELQRLQDAWTKAVILHVSLWSRPYAENGLW